VSLSSIFLGSDYSCERDARDAAECADLLRASVTLGLQLDEMELFGKSGDYTATYMWWDSLATSFFIAQGDSGTGVYVPKTKAQTLIHNALFEGPERLLTLSKSRSGQECALHGLGHARHLGVFGRVERFWSSCTDQDEWDKEWVDQCREGTVL